MLISIQRVNQFDILGNWLSLSELSKLDSAFCNKSSRDHFIDILSSPNFVVQGDENMTVSYAHWISLRKIKVLKLYLKTKKIITNKKFNLDKSKLSALFFNEWNVFQTAPEIKKLANFINSFPALASLSFQNVECLVDRSVELIDTKIWKQLTELTMETTIDPSTTIAFIDKLSSVCNNLTKVSLSGGYNDTNAAVIFAALFKANPNLRHFFVNNYDLNSQIVAAAIEHCTDLQYFEFGGVSQLDYEDFSIVAKMIEKFPNLSYARFRIVAANNFVYNLDTHTKQKSVAYIASRMSVDNKLFWEFADEVLVGCHNIRVHIGGLPHGDVLSTIVENNPNLQHIDIRTHFGSYWGSVYTVHSLRNLLKTCHELQTVVLCLHHSVTPQDLLDLFSQQTKVTKLGLIYPPERTDISVPWNALIQLQPQVSSLVFGSGSYQCGLAFTNPAYSLTQKNGCGCLTLEFNTELENWRTALTEVVKEIFD